MKLRTSSWEKRMCGSTVAKRISFMQAKQRGKRAVRRDGRCSSAVVMTSSAKQISWLILHRRRVADHTFLSNRHDMRGSTTRAPVVGDQFDFSPAALAKVA